MATSTNVTRLLLIAVLAVTTAACGSFKDLNQKPDVAENERATPPEQAPAQPAPVADEAPDQQNNPGATTTPAMNGFAHAPDSSLVVYDMGLDAKPARQSVYDIQHTSLDLSFDFEGGRVLGVATHDLVFLGETPASIAFDGRDMKINNVSFDTGTGPVSAKFKYRDDSDLLVTVPREVTGLEARISIDYMAHPMRNGQQMGMYFVDGPGTDPARPTQIWTLGQPEDNQYWFPSWDYTGDRMSFEFRLTVPSHLETVANGTLVSSTTASDNLRIDHWKIEQPQLNYLAALAVGDFHREEDVHVRQDESSVPLAYFVEHEYADRARHIFGETPAMMAFLERVLGVPYPFENYKQVTVRDFTAGGMENTTATILMHRVQHDDRAALDYSPRDLIMHELAHQWFGDLVTVSDWGNLALNEGLASHMEEAYLEYQYGLEARVGHALSERADYFDEARIFQRPVVWHGYSNPYEMYDDHTYEKASQAFAQLRYEIGDAAFFGALSQFLKDFEGRSATIQDLEKVFARTTSRSLETFFDQWFYSAGHPVLSVSSGYRGDLGIYQFKIKQEQTAWGIREFVFPVDVEIAFENREPYRERIYVSSADTTISIGVAGKVLYSNFNRFNRTFAEVYETKSLHEWVGQAGNDTDLTGRLRALQALSDLPPDVLSKAVAIDRLTNDTSALVRQQAANTLAPYVSDATAYAALTRGAVLDASSKVRRTALEILSLKPDDKYQVTLVDALSDSSYQVVASALRQLAQSFPESAIGHLNRFAGMDSWSETVETAVIESAVTVGSIQALDVLVRYLEADQEESTRRRAVEGIMEIARKNEASHGRVKSLLKELSNDLHASVRTEAYKGLDEL